MANPLFNQLNGNNQNQNPKNNNSGNFGGFRNLINLFSEFKNFMNQMQGRNPQDILAEMIMQYSLSPEQVNMFKAKTNEIISFLGLK